MMIKDVYKTQEELNAMLRDSRLRRSVKLVVSTLERFPEGATLDQLERATFVSKTTLAAALKTLRDNGTVRYKTERRTIDEIRRLRRVYYLALDPNEKSRAVKVVAQE